MQRILYIYSGVWTWYFRWCVHRIPYHRWTRESKWLRHFLKSCTRSIRAVLYACDLIETDWEKLVNKTSLYSSHSILASINPGYCCTWTSNRCSSFVWCIICFLEMVLWKLTNQRSGERWEGNWRKQLANLSNSTISKYRRTCKLLHRWWVVTTDVLQAQCYGDDVGLVC